MKWNELKNDNNFKYKSKISHNFYYRYLKKNLAIVCIKYARSKWLTNVKDKNWKIRLPFFNCLCNYLLKMLYISLINCIYLLFFWQQKNSFLIKFIKFNLFHKVSKNFYTYLNTLYYWKYSAMNVISENWKV